MNIHCPINNPMMGGGISNFETSPVKSLSSNNPMMGSYRISTFECTDSNSLSNIKTSNRYFSDCSSDSGHSFISQDSFASTADSKTVGLNSIKHSSSFFVNTRQNQKNKMHQVDPIAYSSFSKKSELITAIAGKSTQAHSQPLQGNAYSKTIESNFNKNYTRRDDTKHSTTPTARATTNPTKSNPIRNNSTTYNNFLNSKIRPENIDLLLCSSFKDRPNHTATKSTFKQSIQMINNQSYTIHSVSSFILDAHRCPVGKVEAACYYDRQGDLCKIQSKTWPITSALQSLGTKHYSYHQDHGILREFKKDEEIFRLLKKDQPVRSDKNSSQPTSDKKVNTNTRQSSKPFIKNPLDYFSCYSDRVHCKMIGEPKRVHYHITGQDPIKNCNSSQWNILDLDQGKIAEVELVVQYNDKTKQDDLVYCDLNTTSIKPFGSQVKLDANLNPLDYLRVRSPGMTAHPLHHPQYIIFNSKQAIKFDWEIKNAQNISAGKIQMIFGLEQQKQIKLLKCRYEGA